MHDEGPYEFKEFTPSETEEPRMQKEEDLRGDDLKHYEAEIENDAGNIQRTLRTTSLGTAANVQCYNYSEKGHYARNCLKPRVRDSKYFMEQMLLAKHDEAGVILTDERNDFLFDDVY
uniref:CCHC-type domain-containing protein n=1 Tax=Tanacetum cinerariifolium TaxID=118510 RepID=A0A699GZJ4_TANCI|nr:hypothetical protein [Tanacetum cinerariifolium]